MSEEFSGERRKAIRARVYLDVIEHRDGASHQLPVIYLSATGMLVRDASFNLGRFLETENVNLELTLPGVDRSLALSGRIARIEPTDDGELGVGIEFVDLPNRDSEAIDVYVRGVMDGEAAARSRTEV